MNLEAQIREAVLEGRYYNKTDVYDIDEKLIAKPFWYLDEAQDEFEIGRLLYQNKVQVPHFHDLIDLSNCVDTCEKPHYIVMDKLIGKLGWELKGDIKDLAVRQLLVEVWKVIDLGIRPGDCSYDHNSIFNFGENMMYLIDFGLYAFIERPINLQKLREEFKRNIIREYKLII